MKSTAELYQHSTSCGLSQQGPVFLERRRALGGSAALLGLLLAGCSSSPRVSRRPAPGGYPSTGESTSPSVRTQPVNPLRLPESSRDSMMAYVMMALNTPYKFGGTSPQEGFDCSGLVFYALGQVGHRGLPRSSAQWAARSIEISASQLQRGDFVFFNTSGPRYSHMGIYVSDGDFVHAPSSGKVVSMASLNSTYFKRNFIEARTVFA